MVFDIILLVVALLLCIVGIIGAIVPSMPGPPISFIGHALLLLCPGIETTFFVVLSVVISLLLAVVVTILDYLAPVWFTKVSGGSKTGVWGATIGMVLGLIAALFGFVVAIIIGPFIGAFIGEKISGTSWGRSFVIASCSLISFVLTTGLKLVYGLAVLAVVMYEGVRLFL
jgi:uncharacterized protein YqgC (DUF456 family)